MSDLKPLTGYVSDMGRGSGKDYKGPQPRSRGKNGTGSGAGLGGPPQPPPPREPDDTTFSQPHPQFNGPAYNYLRESDRLPTYEDISGEDDPVCKVKLFDPSGRYTYYVAAATNYEGIDGPVMTGYCISPLGPDADEWGDQGIKEVAEVTPGPFGLPIERDIHFKPMRLSEIKKAQAQGGL